VVAAAAAAAAPAVDAALHVHESLGSFGSLAAAAVAFGSALVAGSNYLSNVVSGQTAKLAVLEQRLADAKVAAAEASAAASKEIDAKIAGLEKTLITSTAAAKDASIFAMAAAKDASTFAAMASEKAAIMAAAATAKEFDAKIEGLEKAVASKLAGVQSTVDATVKGVVLGARSEARAAAMIAVKDYGVAVAGGAAAVASKARRGS
jgi:hypothetical protein